MALIKENIDACREELETIKKQLENFYIDFVGNKDFLSTDENYQKFINGTQLGTELNEKLLKILTLYIDVIYTQVGDFVLKINNFCDEQENLNNNG